MKFKFILAILLIILAANTQDAQIIDFTYTHVLQEGGASSDHADKIIIFPDTKQIEKHSFPQICDIKKKLDEGMDQQHMTARSIDVDEHLKGLRSKILQLLHLMQEMKIVKATLAEILEDYDPEVEGFNSTHFTSDLKRLADKQLQLAALRENIENTTLKLNTLIEQYNLNPKNQIFNEVNIRYKVSFANSKIDFYSNLKNDIKKKKEEQGDQVNYTEFFRDLNKRVGNAGRRLEDIDNTINNYTTKKLLEEKIASWNNKIQIEKLLLNEKIDCNNSKGKIKNHNQFNEEIKKTFNDLRLKKKEFDGMNNTQCEGVAKKLEEKIRSQLKITNRAFICSQGLEETQQNLRNKELELKNLKKKLEQLQLGSLEAYQEQYNRTLKEISKDFQTMMNFEVGEYIHSEQEIDKLLQDARKYKQNAENELKALPDASHSTANFKDLEKLVQEIKKQKAKYCKQFSAYEHDTRQVWNKIYRQQKRQRQLAHLRSQYIAYGQKFLALETEYHLISNEIIQYLALQSKSE